MKLIDIVGNTPLPLTYRIAFITNFYREPLLRRMERESGLIRPEWTVLICLAYRDGLNPRDICEITEQPSNTVSRGVAALESRGLISRRPDPDDARRGLLFIEPTGRELHQKVMALFVAAEAEMTSRLSPQERDELVRILDKMCRDVPRWQKLPPYREPREVTERASSDKPG